MERDESVADVRGTWRDWPAILLGVLVVLGLAATISGGKPAMWMWIVGGLLAVAWIIRAGLLRPKR